jgi:NH3-dependent NAD+ synthetase
MMNSILCSSTDTELDIRRITADMPAPEDMYATAPMALLQPAYRQSDEEELHTSFEEAISDRVLAVNRQLQRLSGTLTSTRQVQPQTSSWLKKQVLALRSSSFEKAWPKGILFAALALILLMAGFDLMGLLVLHMH